MGSNVVKLLRSRSKRACVIALASALVVIAGFVPAARSADEPDLIFKRSTVFKWLTPDEPWGSDPVERCGDWVEK